MIGNDSRDLLIMLFLCFLVAAAFFWIYKSDVVINGGTLKQWMGEWDSFLTGGVF